MHKLLDLEYVGVACGNFRKSKNIPRHVIADATGYTEQMVYKFEKGEGNNLTIFLWYATQGFSLEKADEYYNMMYVFNKSKGEYIRVQLYE